MEEFKKALKTQKNKAYSSLNRIKYLKYSKAEEIKIKKLLFKSGIREALRVCDKETLEEIKKSKSLKIELNDEDYFNNILEFNL